MNEAFDRLNAALGDLRKTIKDMLTMPIWRGIPVWRVIIAAYAFVVLIVVASKIFL